MNELALFAGAGGGILGGKLLGWKTVCAVEYDEHARNVLVARQNDGSLEPFPIWDDVRTFDGKPWRGRIDVISGGFPCQDISAAGKGAGLDGERSGLWREMARIIGEVQPRYVLIENSPMLRTRGLTTVLKDLAETGYNARWGVFGACDVGAPHKRERMWILAHAKARGLEVRVPAETVQYDAKCGGVPTEWDISNWKPTGETPTTKPLLGRNANGVAYRVDRIKRIGNGQVPAVVRLAWNILSSGI